jgi:DNA polymerase-3 subunit epsilon
LPSYRLPFVVDALGGRLDDHHDPLADARAVVEVIRGLAKSHNACDVSDLAQSIGIRIGHTQSGIYKGSVADSSDGISRLVQPDLNPDAAPEGYLYGRVVIFTGTLMSMTRRIAWAECARVGAITQEETTKRTNVLVVGDINTGLLQDQVTVSVTRPEWPVSS